MERNPQSSALERLKVLRKAYVENQMSGQIGKLQGFQDAIQRVEKEIDDEKIRTTGTGGGKDTEEAKAAQRVLDENRRTMNNAVKEAALLSHRVNFLESTGSMADYAEPDDAALQPYLEAVPAYVAPAGDAS